ncbi:MAG: acyl-CoA dehydrogenase family protein [Alphaproteobacteria bacterium]|nr:acyl-CoA dehydrogenase family protein [Alphaproteobacteria bacterium]
MDFGYSDKVRQLQEQLTRFMTREIVPRDKEWHELTEQGVFPPPFCAGIKQHAKEEGLWNLFLPSLPEDAPGTRCTNLEYAPLAEIMGRIYWAPEMFNCNAPDTGNMEVFHMFGSSAQKRRYLEPLLDGKIRSAFCMTEPEVASSDATNVQTRIRCEGDEWVIDGRKWFITNAAHPELGVMIVMGVTDPDAAAHRRQSQVLVEPDTPGVRIVRNIPVMHHIAPEGHCEVVFENVRVPHDNLIGEEGGGFAIAQARLGPGRIHHCMRTIGQCEVALQLMIERGLNRMTFGKRTIDHDTVREAVALSRTEIDMARLLCLRTAWLIDSYGNKAARNEVSQIKVVAARLQTAIANRAMQVFGSMGLTPDTPLSWLWTWGRALQFIDGPDEVHLRGIARNVVREYEHSGLDPVTPHFYRISKDYDESRLSKA